MFRIIANKPLAPKVKEMVVDAPLIAAKAEPGQFVIIKVSETGKRIPLTIADFDRDRGAVTIVFQEIGKTTHQLGALAAGKTIPDVLGPQGNPTEMESGRRVIVVGGGIGIAPVFPLARKLRAAGNRVTAVIGYRSRTHVFWEEKMRTVSDELLISTNDGTYGKKGLVTDLLGELLAREDGWDHLYSIGPAAMMRAVAEMTRPAGLKTTVSLNSMMVCGMGMCGACRVTIGGETRFTCLDGPDFDGHRVDFAELIQRLNTYREEEAVSFEKWLKEQPDEIR